MTARVFTTATSDFHHSDPQCPRWLRGRAGSEAQGATLGTLEHYELEQVPVRYKPCQSSECIAARG